MFPMIEHPEITHIERTGYPSRFKGRDLDVDDDYDDDDDDEELEGHYE